jgi:hypothetical protein
MTIRYTHLLLLLFVVLLPVVVLAQNKTMSLHSGYNLALNLARLSDGNNDLNDINLQQYYFSLMFDMPLQDRHWAISPEIFMLQKGSVAPYLDFQNPLFASGQVRNGFLSATALGSFIYPSIFRPVRAAAVGGRIRRCGYVEPIQRQRPFGYRFDL